MTEPQIFIADWQRDNAALTHIRRRVFIDEQFVPEALEWDEHDAKASHFLAIFDNSAVATAELSESPEKRLPDFADFCHALQNSHLIRAEDSRFLFSHHSQGVMLFVDGNSYRVTAEFAENLCSQHIDTAQILELASESTQQLLLDLHHQGALLITDD